MLPPLLAVALLMAAGYWWLGLSESDAGHLLLSALVASVLLLGIAWLFAVLLLFLSGNSSGIVNAAGSALRRTGTLFLVGLVALFVYWVLDAAYAYSSLLALQLASFLTLTLRTPVSPPSMAALFHGILWLVRWVLAPVLLLGAAALATVEGWSGFKRFRIPGVRLWIEIAVLLLGAIWLPRWLLHWIPAVSAF